MSDVKVGSLFFQLGFDVDQVKLNDVVNSIGKLNLNSVLAAVGVAGLVDGLKNIMDTASSMTEEMYKFQATTGLSGEKMKQWDQYAQRMGASAGFVEGTLKQLNMIYGQFLTGSADAGTMKSFMAINQALHQMKMPVLNENDLKNPFNMLEKIRAAMQEIKKNNPSLAQNILAWTHVGDQLLLMKSSFNAANDIPVPTNNQVEQVRSYNSAWTAVGQTLKLLVTDAGADLAPALTALGNLLNTFFVKLHDNAKDAWTAMDALLGIISLFLGPLGQLSYIIYMISTHLKEIGNFFNSGEKLGSGYGRKPESLHSVFNNWGKGIKFAWDLLGPTIPNPLGLNKSSWTDSRPTTNYNTFHISSNDPQAVAKQVDDRLSHHINNSYRQINSNH